MKKIIEKLIRKEDLNRDDIRYITDCIKNNKLDNVQFPAMLCGLEIKGITAEELQLFVDELIKSAVLIKCSDDCIDICGTGGDKKNTFNISTATVFVIAGCGVKVAKHGNRSVSSKSGSFDVLEELGININPDLTNNLRSLDKSGVCFMFAQKHHPIFKNIAEIRKKLGIRTIFNIIGPLLNPAQVKKQLIGVFDPKLTELMAEVLRNKGMKRAMIVHGDGLDEITITGKTKITELNKGKILTYYLDPKDYGFDYGNFDELKVNNKKESVEAIIELLKGKKSKKRDIVVLNSAAALIIAGKASNFNEGIILAEISIDSGRAFQKLEQIRGMLR